MTCWKATWRYWGDDTAEVDWELFHLPTVNLTEAAALIAGKIGVRFRLVSVQLQEG